jgi:hypothetical protein
MGQVDHRFFFLVVIISMHPVNFESGGINYKYSNLING